MFSIEANGLFKVAGKLFIIVGIIFFIVGGSGYISQLAAKKSMCTAEATIISRYLERTEVEYAAEGHVYRTILNYSSDFHRAGDTMTIYYQPGNPEEVRLGEPAIFLVFTFMGAVALGVGIFAKRRYANIVTKRKYLIENGVKLYARIIRIEYDYRYERSHTYAKKLVCQYDSPDGSVHIFASEPIWTDMSENLIGNEVAVYAERGNYDSYYVDLSFIPHSTPDIR